MKNIRTLFIITVIFVILQSSKIFYVFGITPDLLLIILIYYSYFNGSMKGQILGFILGFIEDIISGGIPGFFTLTKTIIGYVAGFLNKRFVYYNFFIPFVMVFIFSCLKGFLFFIFGYIFNEKERALAFFQKKLLFEALFTAFFALYLFIRLDKYDEYKYLESDNLRKRKMASFLRNSNAAGIVVFSLSLFFAMITS